MPIIKNFKFIPKMYFNYLIKCLFWRVKSKQSQLVNYNLFEISNSRRLTLLKYFIIMVYKTLKSYRFHCYASYNFLILYNAIF